MFLATTVNPTFFKLNLNGGMFFFTFPMLIIYKILESWATPNWSKRSVGQEESRSQILSPRSSIPNPKLQNHEKFGIRDLGLRIWEMGFGT